MKKNIFVIGLNDFNLPLLKGIQNAENYQFHPLLAGEDIYEPSVYRVQELMDKARGQLKGFPGKIDAIVGYIDMPVSLMVPVLCHEFGLPSASLESVLKCQHKYLSRLEQKQCIPEHIPQFQQIDPFAPNPLDNLELDYPLWLKPVKAAGSYLGFRIHSPQEYKQAIETIRGHLKRISEPFNYILTQDNLPEDLAVLNFDHCLAEQIISGQQCTLEGYVYHGELQIYGVVDSIRHRNRSSFARYEYPSKLPQSLIKEMTSIAQRFISHIKLDNTPFNVEFFWDRGKDKIWLLEVNTRISQSHCYLFAMVDGSSNHEIMVDMGLGRQPQFPYRQGPYRYAAKNYYRHFEDAIVTKVPAPQLLDKIQKEVKDTRILLHVDQGTRLGHLLEQDSYSYDLAWIFVAGNSRAELGTKYGQVAKAMGLEFSTPQVSPENICSDKVPLPTLNEPVLLPDFDPASKSAVIQI